MRFRQVAEHRFHLRAQDIPGFVGQLRQQCQCLVARALGGEFEQGEIVEPGFRGHAQQVLVEAAHLEVQQLQRLQRGAGTKQFGAVDGLVTSRILQLQ